MPPESEDPQQYLFDYLQEEFRRDPEVRIREMLLDREPGVMVRTDAREFFFPADWIRCRRFRDLEEQVRKIREIL